MINFRTRIEFKGFPKLFYIVRVSCLLECSGTHLRGFAYFSGLYRNKLGGRGKEG